MIRGIFSKLSGFSLHKTYCRARLTSISPCRGCFKVTVKTDYWSSWFGNTPRLVMYIFLVNTFFPHENVFNQWTSINIKVSKPILMKADLRSFVFQYSNPRQKCVLFIFLTKESKLYNVVALAFEKNKLSQQKLKSLRSRYSSVLQDSL